MRTAHDHRFTSLEPGLHEHAVGKPCTLFNGAEDRLAVLNDIDETLVAVLYDSLRRNPRQEILGRDPKRAEILVVLSHNLSNNAILWLSRCSDGKTGGKDAGAKQLPCQSCLSTVANSPVGPKRFPCRT